MATAKLSLYDISIEGLLIEDLLTENEGELTPELEARFDALLREGPQRIEAAAMVVRGLEASADACKAEEQRLKERRLSLEKQADKLKDRMVFATDAAFSGKVKTPLFTIWTQKAADSLSISLDEAYTIDHLFEEHPELVKIEKSIDNAAVRSLLKANETSLKAASEILASPDASEEERKWAADTLSVIPDAIDVEEKIGKRYLRIK
jgi:hypothetical protein